MSAMVERLKQTIVYVKEGPCDPESVVRDVLKAMREPTREMAQAAYDKLNWGYPDGVEANFSVAWQEMIDAALSRC